MAVVVGPPKRAALHGGTGPLHVSDLRTGNPIAQRFVEAGVAAGYRLNNDFNGPEQEGAGYFQMTTRNGRRISTAQGYLKAARRRPGRWPSKREGPWATVAHGDLS